MIPSVQYCCYFHKPLRGFFYPAGFGFLDQFMNKNLIDLTYNHQIQKGTSLPFCLVMSQINRIYFSYSKPQ